MRSGFRALASSPSWFGTLSALPMTTSNMKTFLVIGGILLAVVPHLPILAIVCIVAGIVCPQPEDFPDCC